MRPYQWSYEPVATLFLESTTWGAHCMLFIWMLLLLHQRRGQLSPGTFWRTAVVGSILFAIATFDLVVQLVVTLIVFDQNNTVHSNAVLPDWAVLAMPADYMIQSSLGDAFLIYRCYLVYSKQLLICILPLILLVGQIMWTVGLLAITQMYLESNDGSSTLQTASGLEIAGPAFTLALHVFTTSAIVRRITRTRLESAEAGILNNGPTARLDNAISALVDSAMLYSICQTVFFAFAIMQSAADQTVARGVIQVIGISFNMIVIRGHNASIAHPDVPRLELVLPLQNVHGSGQEPKLVTETHQRQHQSQPYKGDTQMPPSRTQRQ